MSCEPPPATVEAQLDAAVLIAPPLGWLIITQERAVQDRNHGPPAPVGVPACGVGAAARRTFLGWRAGEGGSLASEPPSPNLDQCGRMTVAGSHKYRLPS